MLRRARSGSSPPRACRTGRQALDAVARARPERRAPGRPTAAPGASQPPLVARQLEDLHAPGRQARQRRRDSGSAPICSKNSSATGRVGTQRLVVSRHTGHDRPGHRDHGTAPRWRAAGGRPQPSGGPRASGSRRAAAATTAKAARTSSTGRTAVYPTKRDQAPAAHQLGERLDVTVEAVIVRALRHVLAHEGVHPLQLRRGGERPHGIDRPRRGEQLDAEHARGVGADREQLAARPRRHADVILLSGGGRQAVHRGRVRERLVLGDQRRRRDVRHHEARLEAGLGGEEHVEVRVDAAVEQVDAPLGDARELRDRDGEEVADEADRLGVEVAAREDVVAEDQRVVGHAVDRGAEHLAGVRRACARRRRTPAACSARRRGPARARSPRGCAGSRCR